MDGQIVRLIVEQVADLSQQPAASTGRELNDQTPLYGKNGILDSVGLVSLVVGVEQAVEDRFGKTINLADDRAMSRASSPFKTIGSLAEYVNELVFRALSIGFFSPVFLPFVESL
jgi:acyl carrier protein